jgi:hypothetical protein
MCSKTIEINIFFFSTSTTPTKQETINKLTFQYFILMLGGRIYRNAYVLIKKKETESILLSLAVIENILFIEEEADEEEEKKLFRLFK